MDGATCENVACNDNPKSSSERVLCMMRKRGRGGGGTEGGGKRRIRHDSWCLLKEASRRNGAVCEDRCIADGAHHEMRLNLRLLCEYQLRQN